VNSVEAGCWSSRENQPLRIAAGFPFWVGRSIGNSGAATAPESFSEWCGTSGTPDTRVNGDCDTGIGICYDETDDTSRTGATVVRNGTVLTEQLTHARRVHVPVGRTGEGAGV
jgi:hypothetical protein